MEIISTYFVTELFEPNISPHGPRSYIGILLNSVRNVIV